MTSKQHNNAELIKISKALKYEVQMLYETSRILSSFEELYSDIEHYKTIRNALIESFTIHARLILDFLYGRRKKPTDVIASDYFDHVKDWKEVRPKKSDKLKNINRRVGQEIAHLSIERLNVKDKAWSLNIAADLIHVVRIFCDSISEQKVGEEFTLYINSLPSNLGMGAGG